MAKPQSAGLLLFRCTEGILQVLLVHPGGPFWQGKDEGAWSIPKGEVDAGEDRLAAARREFAEETGFCPEGEPRSLGWIKQSGGKAVHCWTMEGDWDPETLKSNSFTMEWPRGSGQQQTFPEVNRAEWFDIEVAKAKILKGQAPLLKRLVDLENS